MSVKTEGYDEYGVLKVWDTRAFKAGPFFKGGGRNIFSKNLYHPPQMGGGGLIQDGPPSPGMGFGAPVRNIYLGHL